MFESEDWLDAETKAQLASNPPNKLAPPAVGGYTLVLLERGYNRQRVNRTLAALIDDPAKLRKQSPLVVNTQLSLSDALEAQFELICADSISVFLDDEIFLNASATYLVELFAELRKSPEFEPVRVRVSSVPNDERGARYLEQFFGEALNLPITQIVPRKKAHIMQHWAGKVGAIMELHDRT